MFVCERACVSWNAITVCVFLVILFKGAVYRIGRDPTWARVDSTRRVLFKR